MPKEKTTERKIIRENNEKKSYLKNLLWSIEDAVTDNYLGLMPEGYVSWKETPEELIQFLGLIAKAEVFRGVNAAQPRNNEELFRHYKTKSQTQAERIKELEDINPNIAEELKESNNSLANKLMLTELRYDEEIIKAQKAQTKAVNAIAQLSLVKTYIEEVIEDNLSGKDFDRIMRIIEPGLSALPQVKAAEELIQAALSLVEGEQSVHSIIETLTEITDASCRLSKF